MQFLVPDAYILFIIYYLFFSYNDNNIVIIAVLCVLDLGSDLLLKISEKKKSKLFTKA